MRADTREFHLQPRVMQVLVLLYSMDGTVVTKEELILHCWDGAAVTDDSITRVISQLRKLAKDLGGEIFTIRTVPKVGYALDTPADAALPSEAQNAPISETHSDAPTKRRRATILAIPLAIGALFLAWWQFSSPSDWEIGAVKVLDFGPSVQTHPAISPDGEYLVYSSPRAGQNRDLWMVRLGGGEPARLTTHPDLDHHPAFSPSGTKLAFVRSKPGDSTVPCKVIVRDLSAGSETIVARCKKSSFSNSTPAWSLNEQSLYISEEVTEDQDSAVRLVELDLETGERTILTDPGDGGRGDLYPIPSPDGRHLLFIRATTWQEGRHFVLDLSDRSITPLTDEGRFGTFHWTPDGERIVSISSDDRTGLSFYSVDGELQEQRPSGLVHTLGRMSRSGDLFVAESLMQRTVIVDRQGDQDVGAQDNEFAIVAGAHRMPTLSRHGQLAFSTSSGENAIVWLAEGDEQPRRLAELPTFSDHAWSPDGAKLAYATEGGDRLGIFTVDSETMSEMPWDGGPIGSIAWNPDGQSLIFAAMKDKEWRLWKVNTDFASAPKQWSEPNWWAVRSNGSAVFAVRADQPGIWLMSTAGEPAEQVEDTFTSGHLIGRANDRRNAFWATDTQVYFHRAGELIEDNGVIMAKSISSARAAYPHIELGEPFAKFSAGENGRVVFTRNTRDMRLLSLRLIER